MERGGIIKATAVAFAAQGVISAASVVTALLLAGRLDALSYGFWQLFCMAGCYSGLFHLGICDGIYLRLGGKSYSKLDFPSLGTVFWRSFILQIVLSAVLGGTIGMNFGGGRASALIFALAYMPIFNADAYLGHILQATGRTVEYSLSTVIERVGFVIFALAAALAGVRDFRIFALLNISAHLLSLIYCALRCRDIVGSYSSHIAAASTVRGDISSGSRLLLANLSAQLLSGAARIAVIARFGDAEFGRVSFALTLSGIFVQLTAQMSMVLFPSLRRERGDARARIFSRLNTAVCLFFPAGLLGLLPIKVMVGAILPRYVESLSYLGILLPLCIIDGAAQLVCTTFMKVSRREGQLMWINGAGAVLSLVSCFGAAAIFGSTSAVLLAALAAAAVRCCLLEYIFCRESGAQLYPFCLLLLLCTLFAATNRLFGDEGGAAIFAPIYLLTLFLCRRQLGLILKMKKIKALQ